MEDPRPEPINALYGLDPALSLNLPADASGAEPHLGGEVAVARLLELIRKWRTRRAAADALRRAGQTAVPGLLLALFDQNPNVRIAAVQALGGIGGQRAVDGLLGALYDEYHLVRREALLALGRLGEAAALPEMARLLADKDVWVRRDAARALGLLGDPQVIPLLLACGEDQFAVRHAAFGAIAAFGLEAIPALLRGLKSGSGATRTAAVEGFVWLARRVGRARLRHIIERELQRISAAGEPGNRRAVDRLLDELTL